VCLSVSVYTSSYTQLHIVLFSFSPQLGTVYRQTRQSLIDMDVLFRLGDVQPAISDSPTATPLHKHDEINHKGCSVAFHDVKFSYTNREPLIRGVSFSAEAGEKVAIVGGSGNGKSTLLRLLFRFYNPDSGHIEIDGRRLDDITLKSVVRGCAHVVGIVCVCVCVCVDGPRVDVCVVV
jgi:ATP-binding cassette subfamily B (MDR/TAP) protein 7